MTKIDIVSGFLGAGKTTLIKKLLAEALGDTKVVLIENEFGEIGIDGGFLKEAGIEIKEMNSGCICCSLVGDFGTSLKEVMHTYEPERILIEPSGVGKLSDVMKAVQDVIDTKDVALNSAVAVVDASKCKMYIKNFGEFFVNQIAHAGTIVLSRTGNISEEKLSKCIELIREHNGKATIITTPWEELDGKDILAAIEGAGDLEAEMMAELKANRNKEEEHHHHHHHGEECGCEHHHHGEEEHHHHHEEECGCEHHHHGEEEHHHHHEEECGCGHHHEEGHHHHHADEVFTSWGMETPAAYGRDEIERILDELENESKYGFVLRAKGMVSGRDGGWVYFDYVPGESNVRDGKPDVTGKFCVIGSKLKEDALKALFEGSF
ncbi:MAG: cobalamin biosynthesis protein CobW [Lachnospiraceae bacterium]|jgi:G3E family GTPase|nr:cobalamin biosynthesis protein CobW [Lachnospiraceae bacterium]MCI9203166.1 cobalamin biosynthesis protein CobW [Lachnospiraceae bacterium]